MQAQGSSPSPTTAPKRPCCPKRNKEEAREGPSTTLRQKAAAPKAIGTPDSHPMVNSFYRRPLPPDLVAFSSSEGREIFREAEALGGMETFFPLSEHFITQAEPAYCGLGSLTMVLNALQIDPGRAWKGPWRWFDETLLDCCEPLEVVKQQGISLHKVHCLAKCNGAKSTLHYSENVTLTKFREDIKRTTHDPSTVEFIVCSYSRKVLGQTGDGHFSPLGGYNVEKDLVLILDVARFKYPPHWVPLTVLWEAMKPHDPATGRSRGYLLLSRHPSSESFLFTIDQDHHEDWAQLREWLLALHRREALATIAADSKDGSSSSSSRNSIFAYEKEGSSNDGFLAFVSLLPPDVASLITTYAYVNQNHITMASSSSSFSNTTPEAYVTTLVAAIEAHPLFQALTADLLTPFRTASGDSGCCHKVVHEGHALVVFYLALVEWVAADMREEGVERAFEREITQLRIKLQALSMELSHTDAGEENSEK